MTGSEMPDAKGPNTTWPVIPLAALPITDATIEETAEDFILRAGHVRAVGARPFYSTSANGQVIALCHHDREFDAMLRQADQIHADGMSLVIFSRTFCQNALRERVATTDLVHAVARRAEETGARFYFLGGSEEVNRAAVEEMQRLYPRLVFPGGATVISAGTKKRRSLPMSSHRRPIFSGSASGFRWSNASFRAIWTGFPALPWSRRAVVCSIFLPARTAARRNGCRIWGWNGSTGRCLSRDASANVTC